MKGAILTRFPEARLIDLTHEILVHWPAEAGFWLARAYRYFPPGTVHVAVVDPGVGTSRDIVAVRAAGHLFLAPDNGLLAPVVSRVRDARDRAPRRPARLARLGIQRPSATFHGRDIFAPVAAELAAGRVPCESISARACRTAGALLGGGPDGGTTQRQRASSSRWITSATSSPTSTATLIERFRLPLVHAGNHSFPMLRTYGETRPGEYLALVNSFGVIEIARAEGSAAEGLGLSRGAPVVVRDRTDQP